MDISWIFSKLGMFLGLMVILGVMFKVSDMYDVNAARSECNELAKKLGDSIGRTATISPQLIQAEGGVYSMKIDLPVKLHGSFYAIRLDFGGAVVVEYPQGYRGNNISCIGIIPAGAIPDNSAGEYLGVNNAYMISGNATEPYDDDVFVWPGPPSNIRVQTQRPFVIENREKQIMLEFVTKSDWAAFRIESSGDKLLSPISPEGGWEYVEHIYDHPPCQDNINTRKVSLLVKDNGDDKVTIRTGEGSGCSQAVDIVKLYFNDGIEQKLLMSGNIGCDTCSGGNSVYTFGVQNLIRPYNNKLKSLEYIQVNRTKNGMVITLGGIK